MKNGIPFAGLDMVGIQKSLLLKPSFRTLKSVEGHRIFNWLSLDSGDSTGGVLLGWNVNLFECKDSFIGTFSVPGIFKMRQSNRIFLFTSFYTPIDREE